MAEVNLRELRQIVYGCLGEHKLKNKIGLKFVRFGGRGFGRIIVIKEWDSNTDGHKWQPLKRMIRERTRKLYGELPSWILIVEVEYKKEEWKMPESGWGEFQDKFEEFYNEVVGKVPEAEADRNDNACKIAAEKTLAHIKGLGYKVIS